MMPMANEYKKKIHLEKSETLILGVIFIFISGINFLLGFIYGIKKNPQPTNVAHLEVHHEDREIASTSENNEHSPVTNLDKLDIKLAYEEAKQQALEEIIQKEEFRMEPKSIADARAEFFTKEGEDERLPANSNETQDKENSRVEIKKEADKLSIQNQKGERQPSSVKSLFENNPNERRIFIPTPEQWTIQVGSFPTKDQAIAKMDQLHSENVLDAYIRSNKNQNTQ
jgi:cell division septation protein DedD